MRLLNAEALVQDERWEFRECRPDKPAPSLYAILSHTWAEKGEVMFQDIEDPEGPISSSLEKRSGFAKIRGCCAQAVRGGLEWVWIDTCCINRGVSDEVSE
ncbi:hypothetical protein SLS62_004604, partial [Diatrype stigma]